MTHATHSGLIYWHVTHHLQLVRFCLFGSRLLFQVAHVVTVDTHVAFTFLVWFSYLPRFSGSSSVVIRATTVWTHVCVALRISFYHLVLHSYNSVPLRLPSPSGYHFNGYAGYTRCTLCSRYRLCIRCTFCHTYHAHTHGCYCTGHTFTLPHTQFVTTNLWTFSFFPSPVGFHFTLPGSPHTLLTPSFSFYHTLHADSAHLTVGCTVKFWMVGGWLCRAYHG